ncbi:MAG: hypothetical protein AAF696_00465 [Bacteroidota bacterium]
MDLDMFKNSWQDQGLPADSEHETMDKVIALDKGLEKENLWLSIAFSVTIFILGAFVLPLLDSSVLQLLVGSLFFLMGFQALALWMRNISVKRAMGETPATFLKHLINKLNYNIMVTNLIIPAYLLILGSIMTFYIHFLFSGLEINPLYIWAIIGGIWAFFLGVFLYAWPRQRKKDREIILPMIAELKEMQRNF